MPLSLHIASDLHIDACSLDKPKVLGDCAIVAGDCSNGGARETIQALLSLFDEEKIFFVPGNHEAYGKTGIDEFNAELIAAAQGTRVSVLARSTETFGGAIFIGVTLWSDFGLFGSRLQSASMEYSRLCINDFSCIKENGALFTPENARRRHMAEREWLFNEIQSAEKTGLPICVITHHAPHERSLALRYARDLTSGAFISRLAPVFFDAPRLWIHGHTHTSFDYFLGGCRVLANPRGYSRQSSVSDENPSFDPDLLASLG